MHSMRKTFLGAVLLLLAASFTHSLSISAPASLPSNVSWGLSVRLDPTENWTKAAVKIDGAKVLDAYSNGTIALDPYNGQFVIKSFMLDNNTSSTSGLVLYVSHIGLPEGTHLISVESEAGSDSREITSYVALDQNFAAAANDKMFELSRRLIDNENDKRGIRRAVEADGNKIAGLEEKSRLADSKLDSLTAKLDAKVEPLESKVRELEQKQSAQQAQALKDEKNKNAQGTSPIAGLASLAGGAATPIAYLLVAIIAIALLVFGAKFAKEKLDESSIYSSRDEHGLPFLEEKKEPPHGKFMGLGEGKWKAEKKE